jgi:predicted ribosome quality control (RQC) complex YloA/Tae2 family protein
MFFDAAMVARAAGEIGRDLLGARLRDPVQVRHDEVVLVFGRRGLLLSSSPQFGRVCLSAPPRQSPQPQPFGLALRKHLRGSRLESATQPGFDRVLRLDFAECQGFGPESRRCLVIEIMGKHGNMVLLDEEGSIVSCAKHVPARMNRYRQIMEGEPYIPPPDFGKLDPRRLTADMLAERAQGDPDASPRELLFRHCLGTSKVLTAEALERAGPLGDTADRLTSSQLEALAAVVRELTDEAAAEGPVYVYQRRRGSDLPPRFAYPILLRCCEPPLHEADHLGAALEPLLAREAGERRERELRQRLEGAAASQVKDLDGRIARLRQRIDRARDAEGLRKVGELLLSQPHAAKAYAREVELVDYFTDGQPALTVELDPPGDVHGTAQKLFDRYKRASRILKRVPPLLTETERESEYLESVLSEIELAEGLDDLQAIERELQEQGYLRKKQRQTERDRRRKRAEAPRLHRKTSSDGYTILYGTNHLQNDEVLRTAAPDDIWLHVQAAPGAHVLVRTAGEPDKVPQRTLAEAAQTAARWSRLRTQATADVDYTRAKYVRKAKGDRPGMAYYTHQKTLTVRVPS